MYRQHLPESRLLDPSGLPIETADVRKWINKRADQVSRIRVTDKPNGFVLRIDLEDGTRYQKRGDFGQILAEVNRWRTLNHITPEVKA